MQIEGLVGEQIVTAMKGSLGTLKTLLSTVMGTTFDPDLVVLPPPPVPPLDPPPLLLPELVPLPPPPQAVSSKQIMQPTKNENRLLLKISRMFSLLFDLIYTEAGR